MKTHSRTLHLIIICSVSLLVCGGGRKAGKEAKAFIEDNATMSAVQTEKMLEATGTPNGKNCPRRSGSKGELQMTGIYDWTSGFFPGSLWYLYELTGERKWMESAEKWTHILEPVKSHTGTHDIGFIMYCSYGNARRLAPNPAYEDILIESANSLCTRYNDRTKTIKSWNSGRSWGGVQWKFPVIIDNMMNLELLFHAYKVTGDRKYYDIAVTHANTTLKNHVRDDFSTFHVVNYDESTGDVLHRQTCQGYSDNSTWSRGQAWAIYGYTVMYRETKDRRYLDTAEKMARWYIKRLPEDMVPYWDFNIGMEGYTPDKGSYAAKVMVKSRDASAAAIVCSALFELANLSGRNYYRNAAIKMLASLSSPQYRADPGENANFIIKHCTGSVPHKAEIDAALVYGDYYYLEALVRYKRSLNKK